MQEEVNVSINETKLTQISLADIFLARIMSIALFNCNLRNFIFLAGNIAIPYKTDFC